MEDVTPQGVAAALQRTVPVSMDSHGGCPLVSILEYPELPNSSDSETDPNELLEVEPMVKLSVPSSGGAIPWVCSVCVAPLASGVALYRHLRNVHLVLWSYTCHSCENKFKNLHELSSHRSNTHHRKRVSYTQCDYKMTTPAKMHQHVRCHTSGVRCETCGKGYPTLSEMLCHQHLHDQREEYPCPHCELFYHTKLAFSVHIRGKHGDGYSMELTL